MSKTRADARRSTATQSIAARRVARPATLPVIMGDTTRPDDRLNLRDGFAAAALTALLPGRVMAPGGELMVAREAYALADAMIQVRKTTDAPVTGDAR